MDDLLMNCVWNDILKCLKRVNLNLSFVSLLLVTASHCLLRFSFLPCLCFPTLSSCSLSVKTSFAVKILSLNGLEKNKTRTHLWKLNWKLSHLYLNLLPLKKMLLLQTVFIWLDFAHLSRERGWYKKKKRTSLFITKHTIVVPTVSGWQWVPVHRLTPW